MSSHLVNQILAKPYARVITPDRSGGYAAQVLEFPGCFSDGDTPDEAYRNLQEAAENWVEAALAQRIAIPEPFASQGYSGTVSLRLPKSLHRRAAQYAHSDGVSLNQFLVSAIAVRVGSEDAVNVISNKLDDRLERLQTQRMYLLSGVVACTPMASTDAPLPQLPPEMIFPEGQKAATLLHEAETVPGAFTGRGAPVTYPILRRGKKNG